MHENGTTEREARVRRDRALTEGRTNYFLVGPPCFTSDQMMRLRAMVDAESEPAPITEAGLEYVTGAQVQDCRRTRVRSIERNEAPWAYEIVIQCFTTANQLMRLDIVPSMNDPIQLLRYDAEAQGHFRWHADTLPSDMTRKLSLVVPLSEPDEYEGGQLQFNQGGILGEVRQAAGRPIAFPSWLIHQVTPVTAGRRYSLVAWIRGPNWR